MRRNVEVKSEVGISGGVEVEVEWRGRGDEGQGTGRGGRGRGEGEGQGTGRGGRRSAKRDPCMRQPRQLLLRLRRMEEDNII